MKKTFRNLTLIAAILLALPTLAMAKGKKDNLQFGGKVTAVNDTTITVERHNKKSGQDVTKTISVPAGTSITNGSGGTVPLSGLVGKHVKIKESSADVAQSIVVKDHKGKKK